MLEVLMIAFVIVAIFVFQNLYFSIFALVFVVGLAAPGLYAMLSGAPYLPSTGKTMKKILEFAELSHDSRVVDLGCGDGRVIHQVAKKHVKKAVGYEFSLPTYFAARLRKLISGGEEKILYKNFWTQDYRHYDVLICFLMKGSMKRFKEDIWPKLNKGTKVISNSFRMPNVKYKKGEKGVYLYVKK